jgi:hypothetical protein
MNEFQQLEDSHARNTIDARGREVRVLDPVHLYALRRPGPIDVQTLGEIVETIQPGSRRLVRYLIPITILTLVLAVVGLGFNWIVGGPPAWRSIFSAFSNPALIAPIFGGVVGGVIAPIAANRASRGKRTDKARAALLLHKRCPHCGYDLHALPVDPTDGATICPECASAWRLDEPVRPGAAAGGVPGANPRLMFALTLALGILFAAGLVAFLFI